jgi:Family of unknown function (DUF5825)
MTSLRSCDEAGARVAVRLRDNLSEGTVGHWDGPVPDGPDIHLLHHLPPPLTGGDGSETDQRVLAWQSEFRPGLCYYRCGPGFIEVKDFRDPGGASRIGIAQPELVEAFLLCLRPVRLADQGRRERAVMEYLLSERLLLRFGGLVTTAPARMRRWPIPAQFV